MLFYGPGKWHKNCRCFNKQAHMKTNASFPNDLLLLVTKTLSNFKYYLNSIYYEFSYVSWENKILTGQTRKLWPIKVSLSEFSTGFDIANQRMSYQRHKSTISTTLFFISTFLLNINKAICTIFYVMKSVLPRREHV